MVVERTDLGLAVQRFPRAMKLVPIYLGLGIVGACSLSSGLLTIAMYLFVIPGLLLILAAFVFLYGPIVHLPIAAFQDGARRSVVVGAAIVGLTPALWLPLTFNLLTASRTGSLTHEDVAPVQPAPLPGDLLIVADRTGDVGEGLLRTGAVDHYLSGSGSHTSRGFESRAYYLQYARPDGQCTVSQVSRAKDGWCIERVEAVNAPFGGVLELESGKGPIPYKRVSYWRCTPDCTLVSRETAVLGWIRLPVRLYPQSDSKFLWMALARTSVKGPKPETLVARALALPAPGQPIAYR
jgi:hypothetical protein